MRRKSLSALCAAMIAGTMLASSSLWANASAKLPSTQSFSGAYLAGRVASTDNQADAAISYYRQALAYQPDNVLIEQDLMMILLATGNFTEAVPLAVSLRTTPSVERFARLVLAADAINKRRYQIAKEEINYKDPDVMDRLVGGIISSWATFGQGNRKAAIQQVGKLEGQPWYALFCNYHMALMYELNGQKKEAAQTYEKALGDQEGGTAAPDTYERIIVAYATFKLNEKDKKGAIAVLRKGETLLTGRNTLINLRKSIESGKRIPRIVSSPRDGVAEIIYNIGTAVNRAGGESFARIYLNTSLAMRPGHDATLFQLAELAAKINQPEQAIAYYRQVTKSSPYYRDAELRLALSLADNEQTDEAIKLLTELSAQYPDDERLVMVLSGIYMQKQDFAASAKVLNAYADKLKAPERDNWSFFYQRGIAYERTGQWEKAEDDFRKALALSPKNSQVLNYLGYSLIDRNIKLDEALEMVREAAQLRPQDGYIADSLGWAYYKLGRYDEAVKELEKAIKLRPEDATINDHLGDAYWKIGNKLQATFQWNHAIAGKPEPEERVKIEAKLKHGLNDAQDKKIDTADKKDTAPTDAATKGEKKTDSDKQEAPDDKKETGASK